ncbi:secretin receptor-like [Macrobrachium nipponense]|uniref:secretin receptor-like n=1 Tax=Macrobrachium nipponense TaxID=159736 RepID=UPI0030C7B754
MSRKDQVLLGSIVWMLLMMARAGWSTDSSSSSSSSYPSSPQELLRDAISLDHPSSAEHQRALLEAEKTRCETEIKKERASQHSTLRNSAVSSSEAATAKSAIELRDGGTSENVNASRRTNKEKVAAGGENIVVSEDASTLYCPTFFDNVYCWPRTPANVMVSIPCPSYVKGFQTSNNATRFCTTEGVWFRFSGSNKSWTNYSQCSMTVVVNHKVNSSLLTFAPVVRTVSYVGYSVSLATLIIAFTVLASVKRLRCPRNTLHMHLFLSFICRAISALLRDPTAFLPELTAQDYEEASVTGTWACRLFTGIWQYSILSNYAWILMEGLYLHNLIFLALFTDNSAITLYIVLGWGLPFLLVIGWVTARITTDNALCWFTNVNAWVFWTFIRGPISISIVVSFALFMNITRELFLKLRSSTTPETRKYRYRRWARSTLVLVPLFGVHYAALLGFTFFIDKDSTIEMVWLLTDQFFASFQGFFVATLYCLLNAEVRLELRKIWQHWRMTQEQEKSTNFHSAFSQSRTYFSRGTASPGTLLVGGNKKKPEGDQRAGSDPNFLSGTSKTNGGPPTHASCLVNERSSCDDLNKQSLTVSLAVVELQRANGPEDEDNRLATGDSTWCKAADDSTNLGDMGELGSALILQPLSHNAHDLGEPHGTSCKSLKAKTGVPSLPQASNAQEATLVSGCDRQKETSSEGSPLLSSSPGLAESTF